MQWREHAGGASVSSMRGGCPPHLRRQVVKDLGHVHVVLHAGAVESQAEPPRRRLDLGGRHLGLVQEVHLRRGEGGVERAAGRGRAGGRRTPTLFCTSAMTIGPHSASTLAFHESTASNDARSVVEKTIAQAPAPARRRARRGEGEERTCPAHPRRATPHRGSTTRSARQTPPAQQCPRS